MCEPYLYRATRRADVALGLAGCRPVFDCVLVLSRVRFVIDLSLDTCGCDVVTCVRPARSVFFISFRATQINTPSERNSTVTPRSAMHLRTPARTFLPACARGRAGCGERGTAAPAVTGDLCFVSVCLCPKTDGARERLHGHTRTRTRPPSRSRDPCKMRPTSSGQPSCDHQWCVRPNVHARAQSQRRP